MITAHLPPFDNVDNSTPFTLTDSSEVDTINHPPHYTGKIECIDAIEAMAGRNPNSEEIPSQTNILKYLWRYHDKKDSVGEIRKESECLKKARWYLERLISKVEDREQAEAAKTSNKTP